MENLGVVGWFFVILAAAGILFVASLIFMGAWNVGPAAVFGWPQISHWWQGFCILLCSQAIFPTKILKRSS